MTRHFLGHRKFKPKAPCDCITSGNSDKPLQHAADPHAKNCAVYRQPWGRKKPLPNHRHKSLLVRMPNGQSRTVSSRVLAIRLGGQKGGRISQAKGTGHRFDSESGRKAALRLWRKKRKGRSGKRIGWPVKYRPRLDRAAIRAKHTDAPGIAAVFFSAYAGRWVVKVGENTATFISERTALRRLGYLHRKGTKPFPIEILSEQVVVRPGKHVAYKPVHQIITGDPV